MRDQKIIEPEASEGEYYVVVLGHTNSVLGPFAAFEEAEVVAINTAKDARRQTLIVREEATVSSQVEVTVTKREKPEPQG